MLKGRAKGVGVGADGLSVDEDTCDGRSFPGLAEVDQHHAVVGYGVRAAGVGLQHQQLFRRKGRNPETAGKEERAQHDKHDHRHTQDDPFDMSHGFITAVRLACTSLSRD